VLSDFRFSNFDVRFSLFIHSQRYNLRLGCVEGTALSQAVKLTAMVKAAG
jgi:hypothetical protein